MAGNAKFVRAEATLAWLSQFSTAEQPIAESLLRETLLVTRDQFSERLRALIIQKFRASSGAVGLYVERELRVNRGVPNRLFKEPRRKNRRAFGIGPNAIKPTKEYDQDVGSEGIVAQLVSELCREFPNLFISHPGPDKIRKKRIRHFVLVSDFVGSGKRAESYIRAAWKVRSVQSWWSARATCGMDFSVVCYSATIRGRQLVEEMRCQPKLHMVAPCPTIVDNFPESLSSVKDLCARYNPRKGEDDPMGYGGLGALIAFAHGAPNNMPPIFYRLTQNWSPLFPRRVTASARHTFSDDVESAEVISKRLVSMRQTRLAARLGGATLSQGALKLVLVLAAVAYPPRRVYDLALKTGLTLIDVDRLLAKAFASGLVDAKNRLTDAGISNLGRYRLGQAESHPLPIAKDLYYCPLQLRAPKSTI